MNRPWMIRRRPHPRAEFPLFCFPFAGGSAAAYSRWPQLAADQIHVCAVEYPGRGIRVAEEPFLSLPPLVRDLADLMEPVLAERFAFFGHSMGGLVAYELARVLRERGAPVPAHLFVSGTAAPGSPRNRRPLYAASDTEVLEELRNLGGTPPELLADRELMAIAVRALRADYTAIGAYEHRPGAPLDVPVTVFGGRRDVVAPPAQLRGWQAHTTVGCQLRLFPGDHFFLHSAAGEILAAVAEAAGGPPAAAAVGPQQTSEGGCRAWQTATR